MSCTFPRDTALTLAHIPTNTCSPAQLGHWQCPVSLALLTVALSNLGVFLFLSYVSLSVSLLTFRIQNALCPPQGFPSAGHFFLPLVTCPSYLPPSLIIDHCLPEHTFSRTPQISCPFYWSNLALDVRKQQQLNNLFPASIYIFSTYTIIFISFLLFSSIMSRCTINP